MALQHSEHYTKQGLPLDFLKLDQRRFLLDSWATELLSLEADVSMALLSKHEVEKVCHQWERINLVDRGTKILDRNILNILKLLIPVITSQWPIIIAGFFRSRCCDGVWYILYVQESMPMDYTLGMTHTVLQERGFCIVFNEGRNASS